jgi:hypothetical protein
MNDARRQFTSSLALALVLAALPGLHSTASAVPTALVVEGSDLPGGPAGDPVTSINNTAVNHAGGYAVAVNTAAGISRIWGQATGGPGALMRSEGTYGVLVQTSFESFYGMGNNGELCYSALGTGGPAGGFDSVFLDNTPIAVEGDPAPGYAGRFWSFGSRPGVTGSGVPYWVGGLTNSVGGSTQIRGLWISAAVSEVLLGTKIYTGFPFALGATNSPTFDYRFSAEATHHIAPVLMNSGSTAHDGAMLMDKASIVLGGNMVREQTVVPASIGGVPGELWANFDFCGVTESGQYFFTGDTQPNTVDDEFILKNGNILYREGQILDGETLSGLIEGAYMNENGDIAYIWDIKANTIEALYVNDDLVLVEMDPIDITGDGIVDANTRIRDFTGISSLTMSDRNAQGDVNIYCVVDVDTLNTTTTTDDVECFICLTVNVEPPVAVELLSFELAGDIANAGVRLDWTTANESEHAGFHVERAPSGEGPFTRLTRRLLTGDAGRYTYLDGSVDGGTTWHYRLAAVDRSGREEILASRSITTPEWAGRPELGPNHPNPFPASTTITFSLPAAGSARLAVFDVSGRLVRSLVDGPFPAGEHTVTWDGRTEDGRTSGGGVYFYSLVVGGDEITRRMIRLPGN